MFLCDLTNILRLAYIGYGVNPEYSCEVYNIIPHEYIVLKHDWSSHMEHSVNPHPLFRHIYIMAFVSEQYSADQTY